MLRFRPVCNWQHLGLRNVHIGQDLKYRKEQPFLYRARTVDILLLSTYRSLQSLLVFVQMCLEQIISGQPI